MAFLNSCGCQVSITFVGILNELFGEFNYFGSLFTIYAYISMKYIRQSGETILIPLKYFIWVKKQKGTYADLKKQIRNAQPEN